MTSHLIHGLWHKDSGLHLWIEQIEGHRIVGPAEVPDGTFPSTIEALIRGKEFRHRVRTTLLTPKGRQVQLPIPTLAFTPEQAVQVLAQVQAISPVTASKEQLAGLADDLKWLAHMEAGLEQFVRAGRVTIKLGFIDHQWWPTWQLSSGLGERGWIAQMTAAAPGVLVANAGPGVAEDIAAELPHWIANSILRELADRPRASAWHDFSHALLHSDPLRRGSAQLVSALNAWKDSITSVDIQLVFIVEEPPRDIEEYDVEDVSEIVWPVRVQVRSGVDSPIPITSEQLDRSTMQRLAVLRREAILCTELLDSERPLPDGHPAKGTPMRWGLEMEPTAGQWDCYLNTDELVRFIQVDSPVLKLRGFTVMLPRAWSSQETTARIEVGDPSDGPTQSTFGLEQIVNYNWRVSVGDVDLTDQEMRELVESKSGLIRLRGDWVLADTATVKRIGDYMSQLADLQQKKRKSELDAAILKAEMARKLEQPGWQQLAAHAETLARSFNETFHTGGEVSLAELRQLAIERIDSEPIEYVGNDWQAALAGGLAGIESPAPTRIELPGSVHAELREYQRRGVDWLHWMAANHLGAVLADDMGLGKTLQLLSLEAVDKAESGAAGPSLVVAPTSVVGNWAREAAKFVPEFRVLVHHGTSRLKDEEFLDAVGDYDLVITSYGTIARDHKLLSQVTWHRVTLDEAQQIKNSGTKVSKAVRSLKSAQRVALTGTPVENRLSELRNILDFCNPGILGDAKTFRTHFATAIEKSKDDVKTERLRALTAPFILRRLKTDPAIIDDLPEKTEVVLTVEMTTEQAALYTAYVDSMQKAIQEAQGMSRRGLVLASLTKIKQICNHPAHFLGDGSPVIIKGKHRSGKVAELMRLIEEAQESGQRMLIFTQYKAFGDILTEYLSDYFGSAIPFLHGGVTKTGRDKMVEAFQQPDGAPVMVLSLKAGGTGLNLTAASIVVHMDRWWNPAVENQATDRAFRIGQLKDVTVYKMITAGTLEQSIQDILDGKMQLASAVVGEGEGWLTELSMDELAMLMSYRGGTQL